MGSEGRHAASCAPPPDAAPIPRRLMGWELLEWMGSTGFWPLVLPGCPGCVCASRSALMHCCLVSIELSIDQPAHRLLPLVAARASSGPSALLAAGESQVGVLQQHTAPHTPACASVESRSDIGWCRLWSSKPQAPDGAAVRFGLTGVRVFVALCTASHIRRRGVRCVQRPDRGVAGGACRQSCPFVKQVQLNVLYAVQAVAAVGPELHLEEPGKVGRSDEVSISCPETLCTPRWISRVGTSCEYESFCPCLTHRHSQDDTSHPTRNLFGSSATWFSCGIQVRTGVRCRLPLHLFHSVSAQQPAQVAPASPPSPHYPPVLPLPLPVFPPRCSAPRPAAPPWLRLVNRPAPAQLHLPYAFPAARDSLT